MNETEFDNLMFCLADIERLVQYLHNITENDY